LNGGGGRARFQEITANAGKKKLVCDARQYIAVSYSVKVFDSFSFTRGHQAFLSIE
jgi:hypothetical protein